MKIQVQKNPCPLQIALQRLGDSWKLLVLRELWNQPRRFSDLRRAFPWISTTCHLPRAPQGLEEDGLVARSVVATRPPMVAYSLLQDDPHLREAIEHLTRWGQQYSKRRVPPKP